MKREEIDRKGGGRKTSEKGKERFGDGQKVGKVRAFKKKGEEIDRKGGGSKTSEKGKEGERGGKDIK